MPIIDNKILTPITYVQDLSRHPTPSETMTDQLLKAKFDKGAEDLRIKHNSLIDDVISTDGFNIKNSGIQTINGVKTFVESPIIPTPTTDMQPTNKKYVSDNFTTKIENNLKANAIDVYTKGELAPFLRGGDTLIVYEVFSIVNSNNGNGTFTYKDKNNNNIIGTLNVSGYQIFTLLEGDYMINQNRINMTINDTLQRSTASGGLLEIDATHVALTSPEGAGAEITIQYFERVGITGTGLIIQGTVEPPSGFVWYKEV